MKSFSCALDRVFQYARQSVTRQNQRQGHPTQRLNYLRYQQHANDDHQQQNDGPVQCPGKPSALLDPLVKQGSGEQRNKRKQEQAKSPGDGNTKARILAR